MGREHTTLKRKTHDLEDDHQDDLVDELLLDSILASAMGETHEAGPKLELRTDQDSLSSMIWETIQTDPEFAEDKYLINNRMEDSMALEDNRSTVDEDIRAASIKVISSVDCFIGTSTAVKKFGTRYGKELRVAAIILEESGQMTEVESSIAHTFSSTISTSFSTVTRIRFNQSTLRAQIWTRCGIK